MDNTRSININKETLEILLTDVFIDNSLTVEKLTSEYQDNKNFRVVWRATGTMCIEHLKKRFLR